MQLSCPAIANAGIVVTVVDSATGAVAGRNAGVVARSATFVDSISPERTAASDGPFGLVYSYSKAGTYTVTVRKSGYRDWVRGGIVVAAANACALATVNVTAKLQQ